MLYLCSGSCVQKQPQSFSFLPCMEVSSTPLAGSSFRQPPETEAAETYAENGESVWEGKECEVPQPGGRDLCRLHVSVFLFKGWKSYLAFGRKDIQLPSGSFQGLPAPLNTLHFLPGNPLNEPCSYLMKKTRMLEFWSLNKAVMWAVVALKTVLLCNWDSGRNCCHKLRIICK